MAEIKKFLDNVALGTLVDQNKAEDAKALKAAKDYSDGLAKNYDAAGSASTAEANAKTHAETKVNELANGQVKLNKEATKVVAPAKTFKRTAKVKKVVITLRNSKNKALANKRVILNVNKKNYVAKTNKKGQAAFNIKLTKKGNFRYTIKFAGDSQYKPVNRASKIRIK